MGSRGEVLKKCITMFHFFQVLLVSKEVWFERGDYKRCQWLELA